jgi:H+/gluconate symporter-like permease
MSEHGEKGEQKQTSMTLAMMEKVAELAAVKAINLHEQQNIERLNQFKLDVDKTIEKQIQTHVAECKVHQFEQSGETKGRILDFVQKNWIMIIVLVVVGINSIRSGNDIDINKIAEQVVKLQTALPALGE